MKTIKIELICPKCNTKQNAFILGESWENKCFYCDYIFSPDDFEKAAKSAGYEVNNPNK